MICVNDGSSGVAHPARPSRTGSAHDRGEPDGDGGGHHGVVVTAPALQGAWRVRATPEEVVMFQAQIIAQEFIVAV